MTTGAGSPSFHSFSDDLSEDRAIDPLIQHPFEVLSLSCSDVQILLLASAFRRYSNRQILRWTDEFRLHSSPDSSSSRNSLFSVLSFSSQATTLSNQSQPRSTFNDRLQIGAGQQPQDHYKRHASPLNEVTEIGNQRSPVPTHNTSPTVHICVACNIPCTNKSSLSRHQKQHCERKAESLCWLCVPVKNFYRKDKLSQHHLDNHGGGCVPGCKKQGGLCERHLNRSVFELPPKKAWGCPCCLQCFDTFEAWTKHGGNHPVQNDKIVGWSLSTMVESLVHQPYLKDAVAHLPWHACDPAKAKADICQSLREALERHKLPDAVQDHYDYRHLQRPEALAQYAFRLMAYGGPYLDDVSTVVTKSGAAEAATKQLRNEYLGRLNAPTFQRPSGPPASGYWSPEDPFTYRQSPQPPTDPTSVRDHLDVHLFDDAFNVTFDTNLFGRIDHSSGNGQCLHTHGQTLYPASTAPSGEVALSSHTSGSLGRMPQDAGCSERRRKAMNTEKPLPNPLHLPSSARLQTTQMDPVPSGTPLHDGAAPDISQKASTPESSKDSARIELMDATPNSPRHARMSSRMSFQWEAWVDLPPEELHDP